MSNLEKQGIKLCIHRDSDGHYHMEQTEFAKLISLRPDESGYTEPLVLLEDAQKETGKYKNLYETRVAYLRDQIDITNAIIQKKDALESQLERIRQIASLMQEQIDKDMQVVEDNRLYPSRVPTSRADFCKERAIFLKSWLDRLNKESCKHEWRMLTQKEIDEKQITGEIICTKCGETKLIGLNIKREALDDVD